jgi:type III pantothenate kinase
VQGIIDIGNTAIKVALFDDRRIVESSAVTSFDEGVVRSLQECEIIYVGSTSSEKKTEEILAAVQKSNLIRGFSVEKLRVKYSDYDFNSLGADRIANVEQALSIYNEMPVLVIDAGTCITYEAVCNGNFQSFGISPGINMRLKAMHAFTGRLPDLQISDANFESIEEIMSDSKSSMIQSVALGTVAEVNDRINIFAKQFSDGKVVLTGGDAERLKKHIKISTFADPYWTLKGYNEILLQHI